MKCLINYTKILINNNNNKKFENKKKKINQLLIELFSNKN